MSHVAQRGSVFIMLGKSCTWQALEYKILLTLEALDTSHVKSWDIKFISTLFWITTDLSAQSTSLMDIIEPHQFFGGGLFRNMYMQI